MMPLLARLYIKTALAYLGGSLLLGVVLAQGPAALPGWTAALGPTWVHLLVVGWLTQLIFGVAFWFFPRYSKEKPHGTTALAWAAYGMLNGGLLLRLVAEPAVTTGAEGPWRALLVLSAALQALGVALFVAYLWPRVRTK